MSVLGWSPFKERAVSHPVPRAGEVTRDHAIDHRYHPAVRSYQDPHMGEIHTLATSWFSEYSALASHHGIPFDGSHASISQLSNRLEQVTYWKALRKPSTATLAVICGPQAVGKGTVGTELRALGIGHVPNYVTRPLRRGEVHGQDKIYVDSTELEQMHARGELLAMSEQSHTTREPQYKAGLSRQVFLDHLNSGRPFFIERNLDTWLGIEETLRSIPEVGEQIQGRRIIFLLPPNLDELSLRAIQRVLKDYGVVHNQPHDPLAHDTITTELERSLGKPWRLGQTKQVSDIIFIVNDDPRRVAERIALLLAY